MQFSQTLRIFIKTNFKSFPDDESDGAEELQRKAFNTPSLPRAPVFGGSHSQSEMAMSQSQEVALPSERLVPNVCPDNNLPDDVHFLTRSKHKKIYPLL